jgi:hypothetical protein
MKKIFLLPLIAMLSFTGVNDGLTKAERKAALTSLKETKEAVLAAVKGLSEAQLQFKPAPDRWSIEECVKHIAVSESVLWEMCVSTLRVQPNPDLKSDIKMTDEELVKRTEDRSVRSKTMEQLEPANSPFKNATDALNSFKIGRDQLLTYIKSTQEEMRVHVAKTPLGVMDAYQIVLLISAHSKRHTLQIEEVKADPNFPKQ